MINIEGLDKAEILVEKIIKKIREEKEMNDKNQKAIVEKIVKKIREEKEMNDKNQKAILEYKGDKKEYETMGSLSDGYHSFDELYHHRMVLFAIVCSQNRAIAWKSKFHDDGSFFDGYFIVGIGTKEGQATYHYSLEYWDMFKCRILDTAPAWDGHTADQAIKRLESLIIK